MNRTTLTALALSLTLVPATSVRSAPADPPPGKGPTPEQAMAAYEKAGTPGEEHKKMEFFVGSFTAKVKMWTDPKAEPQESEGTAEMKMALGGRFLEQHYEGTFMGKPFRGIGYTGYDNLKKLYVSFWMDNTTTSMLYTNGKWDDTGTVLVSAGKIEDPVTGKGVSVRTQVRKLEGEGPQFAYEMWMPGPDKKFFRSLEVVYTRK